MGSINILNNWKIFLSVKSKRNELALSLVLLAAILFFLTRFFNYVVEPRSGVILNDPVLNLFFPVDLTWLTFGLIYISLIAAVIFLIQNPEKLLFAVQCYGLMVIFRIAMMYILPLEPPPGMIPLADPFVEIFGTGDILTKDLFFSGHTATLLILFLTAEGKRLRYVFLFCTFAVAISVLLQHVHYTVDVLAAPFFAYCAYAIVKNFRKREI